MGNAYNDDEFDDFGTDDGQGQNEPNWVTELRKQNRELAKQNKALSEELGTFKTQARTSSLADLLKAKGVNPKAAKFYPSDLAVDEESLAKWLEADGDVFAPAASEEQEEQSSGTTATEETSGGDEGEQVQLPDWARDYFRIQQQEQAGETVTTKDEPAKVQRLVAAAENAKSADDFIGLLQSGQLG